MAHFRNLIEERKYGINKEEDEVMLKFSWALEPGTFFLYVAELTPLQMETASLDMALGYETLCSIMDWKSSSSSSPSNGGLERKKLQSTSN